MILTRPKQAGKDISGRASSELLVSEQCCFSISQHDNMKRNTIIADIAIESKEYQSDCVWTILCIAIQTSSQI